MSEKFAMIVESGTTDKLMAASILVAGAAAMGKDVTVFLTFGGLMAFKKGWEKAPMVMPNEFKGLEGMLGQVMKTKNIPHWMKNFKDAKEVGDVHVYACGATMDMFDLKKEDLEPIVEDVVGVATFMQKSEGAQTVFI